MLHCTSMTIAPSFRSLPEMRVCCIYKAYQLESQVSDTSSKLGNRPFIGGSPQTLPYVLSDDHLGLMPLLSISIPNWTSLECSFNKLIPIQNIAHSGKAPNLILSSGIMWRLDGLEPRCEVAASETWLSSYYRLELYSWERLRSA
jgi:hypothetical protein